MTIPRFTRGRQQQSARAQAAGAGLPAVTVGPHRQGGMVQEGGGFGVHHTGSSNVRRARALLAMPLVLCVIWLAVGGFWPASVTASSRYPLLQLGTTVSGQLSGDVADEWFRVQLPSPGRLDLRAESAGDLTISLRLYFEQTVLDADTGGSSQLRQVGRGDLYTGTYLVRVTRTSGSGSYSLRASHRPSPYGTDEVRNDSLAEAVLSVVNEETQGLLGFLVQGQADTEAWYKVTMPGPGLLAVAITAEPTLTFSARLYAADGATVLDADTSGSSSERLLERPDLQAGTYYVRLNRTSGHGGYTLLPRFEAQTVPADGPAANTRELARPIALDQVTRGILGYFDGSETDTEDWFLLELPAAGSLALQVLAQDTLSFVARLYGPFGSVVLDADTGGAQSRRLVQRGDLAAGTYYLRITRSSGFGRYTVHPDYRRQALAKDSEPNDTAAQAGELVLNAISTGHLGYFDGQQTDTEDWYFLDITENGELTIHVEAQEALAIHLRLYDGEAASVLQAETAGTASARTVTRADLGPGRYYLRISRSAGHGGYTVYPVFIAAAPVSLQRVAGQMTDGPLLSFDEPQSALMGYDRSGRTESDSWHRLVQPVTGPLQVSVVAQEPLTATLRLYNEWGNVVIRSDTTGVGSARLANVNSQAGGRYNVRITRSGGQGPYSVLASMAARGVWSNPKAHTYPAAQVNTAGATMSIAVVNAGQEAVAIQDVQLTGPDSEEFHLLAAETAAIPAREQRVFAVAFRPTSPGPKEAALQVTTAVGSLVIPLVGTAYGQFPTELGLAEPPRAEPLPAPAQTQVRARGPEDIPDSGAAAWTDWQIYGPRDRVVVHWADLPGNDYDWIALAPKDAADDEYRAWMYTGGSVQGTMEFGTLQPGEYEVRVYFSWPAGGYEVQSRYPFTITDPMAGARRTTAVELPTATDPMAGERRVHEFASAPFAMRFVPPGIFPASNDDRGIAAVERGYWLAETPVTYELWYTVRQWAEGQGYTFANPGQEGSRGAAGQPPTDAGSEPVVQIAWYDAVVWSNALSEWAGLEPVYIFEGTVLRDAADRWTLQQLTAADTDGFRLPTSAEWELAARYLGPRRPTTGALAVEAVYLEGSYWTPGSYAGGAAAHFRDEAATTEAAWSYENSDITGTHGTQPVGQKPPGGNGLGLFDMSGNVWEWCFDERLDQRVLRGGSWFELAVTQQLGLVRSEEPDKIRDTRGLRVAQSQNHGN